MPHSQRDKKHTESFPSLSGLNSKARSLLECIFPVVIVEGGISNFALPFSGHWYLALKDKSSQIRCSFFLREAYTDPIYFGFLNYRPSAIPTDLSVTSSL